MRDVKTKNRKEGNLHKAGNSLDDMRLNDRETAENIGSHYTLTKTHLLRYISP